MKVISIFFITGTSGAGKSTLTDQLKKKLPPEHFVVYDFDENGVPADADQRWRKETTDYWLARAEENHKQSKSTVVCGVSVPSEIVSSSQLVSAPIYFGCIKINDATISQRLDKRGWSKQLIQDNINWAHYLENEVKAQKNGKVIDCSKHTVPEQTADEFVAWILNVGRER